MVAYTDVVGASSSSPFTVSGPLPRSAASPSSAARRTDGAPVIAGASNLVRLGTINGLAEQLLRMLTLRERSRASIYIPFRKHELIGEPLSYKAI